MNTQEEIVQSLVNLTDKDPMMECLKFWSPFDRIMQLIKDRVAEAVGTVEYDVTISSEGGTTRLSLPSSYWEAKDSDVRLFVPSFTLAEQRKCLSEPSKVEITIESHGAQALARVKSIQLSVINDRATSDPYCYIIPNKEGTGAAIILPDGQQSEVKYDNSWKWAHLPKGQYPFEIFHTTDFESVIDRSNAMERPRTLRPFFQYYLTDAHLDRNGAYSAVIYGPANLFFATVDGCRWKPTSNQSVGPITLESVPLYSVPAAPYGMNGDRTYKAVAETIDNPLHCPVIFVLYDDTGVIIRTSALLCNRIVLYLNRKRLYLDAETVRRMWVLDALLESSLFDDSVHNVGTLAGLPSYVTKEKGGYVVWLRTRVRDQDTVESDIDDFSHLLDSQNSIAKYLKAMTTVNKDIMSISDTAIRDYDLPLNPAAISQHCLPLYNAYDAAKVFSQVVSTSVLISYCSSLGSKKAGQATLCSTLAALMTYTLNSPQWIETRVGKTLNDAFNYIEGCPAYEVETIDEGVTLPAGVYDSGTLFLVRCTGLETRTYICRALPPFGDKQPLQIVFDPLAPSTYSSVILEKRPGCEYTIRTVKSGVAKLMKDGKSPMALVKRYGNADEGSIYPVGEKSIWT